MTLTVLCVVIAAIERAFVLVWISFPYPSRIDWALQVSAPK